MERGILLNLQAFPKRDGESTSREICRRKGGRSSLVKVEAVTRKSMEEAFLGLGGGAARTGKLKSEGEKSALEKL